MRGRSLYTLARTLQSSWYIAPRSISPSSTQLPNTSVVLSKREALSKADCCYVWSRWYKAREYLRHDVMSTVLTKFLDSKGVPQDAIDKVLATKHYYAFDKTEFERFERVMVWLGTIGLYSGKDIGKVLSVYPNFLWIDINLLESKTSWFIAEMKYQRNYLGGLLAKNPNFLFHHAEVMGNFVQFLEMLRIDTKTVSNLIKSRPDLMEHCEDLEEIKSAVNWFHMTIGLEHSQIGEMFLKAPDLLNPVHHVELPKLYGYMSMMGFDLEDIKKVMIHNPSFMLRGGKGVKVLAKHLRKIFALRQRSIVRILVTQPGVLTIEKNQLKELRSYLIELGFRDDKILWLLQKSNSLLLENVKDDLKPKVDFLTSEMGRKKSETLQFPEYLAKELDFIQRRFEFLKRNEIHEFKLEGLVEKSDAVFAKNIADSTLEKYKQFEDWWKVSKMTKSSNKRSHVNFNEKQSMV